MYKEEQINVLTTHVEETGFGVDPVDPESSGEVRPEEIPSKEEPSEEGFEENTRTTKLKVLLGQGTRYLVVGFSSFAIEYLLFLIPFLALGLHVVLSNVIAISGSSLFNFIMSRSWTFKSTSSLPRSIVLYLILFSWNQFFSSWAILMLVDVGLSALIAKVITMAIIVCWNFLLYRKVVFI